MNSEQTSKASENCKPAQGMKEETAGDWQES